MSEFDPCAYGPVLSRFLDVDRCRELVPRGPNNEVHADLNALTLDSVFSHTRIVDRQAAQCVMSSVWLLHDFLDHSHTISQKIETPSGSYLHGIMHRREPDYSNAKYWFRRVGEHPVYEQLADEARQVAEQGETAETPDFLREGQSWSAAQFVDLCQAAESDRSELHALCRQIAMIEWELVFDYCYRQATQP